MELTLEIKELPGYVLLQAAGELDSYTAGELRLAFHDWLTQYEDAMPVPTLVVDMLAVYHLDSTGLGVLLAMKKHCNVRGSSVHLLITAERILKALKVTGLIRIFSVHPDIESIPLA